MAIEEVLLNREHVAVNLAVVDSQYYRLSQPVCQNEQAATAEPVACARREDLRVEFEAAGFGLRVMPPPEKRSMKTTLLHLGCMQMRLY
ncbi:hypothetical protein SNOG_16322 [Parastagonospora nodorum SN15]|uniref:Uncharacterized protein n=1 Tax=Phaeosphaeria nodorum (strain SN15 / ATCC MYA-4574 / FGSC 10173) TaxID=321614 RepID=Q0TW07_PHANO|nr:hypothetical protein SNOG_16322 [Parastagonospora nodorum SN15]EAT76308.1 hypothetical protein SNOG_16322 [Parastagonospora nodorum SN15]